MGTDTQPALPLQFLSLLFSLFFFFLEGEREKQRERESGIEREREKQTSRHCRASSVSEQRPFLEKE